MDIQIYDQISIIRNCSKVKLRHAFSLGLGSKVKLRHAVFLRFGLQGVKIAQNVVKIGVHGYLSNGEPKL